MIVEQRAALFAALGDPTRLALVEQLAAGGEHRLSDLVRPGASSRQAISKHLAHLERAGILTSLRSGRERYFRLDATALAEAETFLAHVANQWENALVRLQKLIEH